MINGHGLKSLQEFKQIPKLNEVEGRFQLQGHFFPIKLKLNCFDKQKEYSGPPVNHLFPQNPITSLDFPSKVVINS